MSKKEFSQNHAKINSAIFKQVTYSVWGIVGFYTVFYWTIGAYFASASLGIAFILTPLILFLEKNGFYHSSRLLLLSSGNFYIFATSLGFGHTINAEYYLIAAPMIGLLIAEAEDILSIFAATFLPVLVWTLIYTLGTTIIPTQFIFVPDSTSLFIKINFFGAFGLATFLIFLSAKTLRDQRLQLTASAKMSSLGEMAAGMAHEINSPLAVILLNTENLQDQISQDAVTKEEILKSLSAIRKTTDRIGTIVKGLKFFARAGAGSSFAPSTVRNILEDTMSFCQERFRSHGVELKFNKQDLPELWINCRSTEISQVFLNLLNNSFDAIDKLERKWVSIEVRDVADRVQLRFTDSGGGIPKEIQDKVLQPFFTTKEVGKGTGLGLSISKGIIEAHGGKLFIDNKCPNTCFVIELPKYLEPLSITKAA